MSALSDYLEENLLNLLYNKDAFTGPTTWVGLLTTDPTDANAGNEVSGNSYAREKVFDNGLGSPDWNVAVIDGIGYVVDNSDDIEFTTATGSWGTIAYFGIYDALTNGNLLHHGALTASKSITTGETFKFAAGDLNLRLE